MMAGFGTAAGLGWVGMSAMALIWIGVILLILWAVSNTFPAGRPTTESDAREVLRQRFARGEIGREEFEQARAALR